MLWMPAALYRFKPLKIFNIFSGGVSENSKFTSLNLILLQKPATLISVKIFGKEVV